ATHPPPPHTPMHENDLLASLAQLFASSDPGVLVGSGPDDCAHLMADGRQLAMTADAFVEGSHFLPDTDPRDVAAKAVAASLSDLAASACRAQWILVTLCLRKGLEAGWAGSFAHGLADAAARYGVSVVGGDVVSGPATFVSVTAVGEPLPGGPILRSGGKAGDVLVVTGSLGGSLLGRHLRPEPRLAEIAALMAYAADREEGFPSAAMDLSDGLSLDLARLCRESGVGAVVEAEAMPIAEAARQRAKDSGKTPLAHALSDGEDFELLLALPPALWTGFSSWLAEEDRGLAPFTRIGTLRIGSGVALVDNGKEQPLAAKGYEHQW
ncbi:MAG: thiamine-phosphate kinase, partial [Planctomycetaceae bacterium]|nr:thiamine-phosphate kinase [Planctomycetaceae bacterium]